MSTEPPESAVQPNKHTPVTPQRHSSRACVRQVRNLRRLRALQLPVCVRPVKRALAAAAAPTCLQRALRQLSAPPRKLAATCTWAEQPTPPLRLMQKPLLGSCLAEVLQTPPPAPLQETDGKPIHPELPPYPESLSSSLAGKAASVSGMERFKPRPRPNKLARSTASTPTGSHLFTHPAQASLELLARRAGGYRVVSQFSGKPQHAGRFAALSSAVRSFSQARAGFMAVSSAGLQPGWLARLSRRLDGRFSQVSGSPRRAASVGFDESAFQEGNTMPGWVARALALDLAGQEISQEWLLHLAGAAESLSGRPSPRSRPSDLTRQTASPDLLSNPAERSASGVTAWDAPFSDTPRGEAPSPIVPPPTGSQQGFYPQSGSLALPAAGQPNFRPLLAPPLAAETPPTLLPPQEVFDAPTPYASAAARQAARRDEANLVEEDLDVLAVKIKRILDDEARRHGVQV